MLLLALDAIAIAVLIFELVKIWLRSGRSSGDWPHVLLLLWFFLPVGVALAASDFRPLLVPRYFLASLPAFLLAVSAGLMRIRPRSVAWTLGGAVFALSFASIPSNYDLRGVVEDWQVVSSGILTRAEPGDKISIYPDYATIPFEYYRSRKKPLPDWPEDSAAVTVMGTDWVNRLPHSENPASNVHPPTSRLWIIFYHPAPMTTQARVNIRTNLASWRSKGWRLLQAQEYPNVSVMLFGVSSAGAVPDGELPNLFQQPNSAAFFRQDIISSVPPEHFPEMLSALAIVP